MNSITINGLEIPLPPSIDDAYALESSFIECSPENYRDFLKAMCLIFSYHGECNALRSLSELASIHFGIV